ncbi:MAG: hypothetical protein LBF88_06355 [Planctomycetaceae bacterium]|jgi:hypothetical protein|nr:hypothetical protein [Planctomycetaceae bacterium]
MKKAVFLIVTFLIAVYCLLFFATPFEPYAGLNGNDITWTRFSFFSYLLLPDEYFAMWFVGLDGMVSLLEQLGLLSGILCGASICLMAASGYGCFILLLPPFKSWRNTITQVEFKLLATIAGLSLCSLTLFCFGLCGNLNNIKLIKTLTIIGMLLCLFLNGLFSYQNAYASQTAYPLPKPEKWSLFKKLTFLIIFPIFSVPLILGGMIPSTDYDVLSYHLAGAREFVQTGQIGFLPHNVYADMPFGAEMFYVWGRIFFDDSSIRVMSCLGAMSGKTLIALTTILTALGLYAFCKRFFSETAGLVAFILYISSPWIIYVSTAGLIDSVVGMYAFFAIYAAVLTAQCSNDKLVQTSEKIKRNGRSIYYNTIDYLKQINWFPIFLTGFFAGSAAACKYPAILFAVVPVGIFIAVIKFKKSDTRSVIMSILIYVIGVSISCGGWYFKNYYYTGNPVYPLCFSVFGDSTGSWTSEIDRRWTQIHSPHDFRLITFFRDFRRVGLSSSWNAPLTIPFFLIAVVVALKSPPPQRRIFCFLISWLAFVFAAWWFLTHRIDRFWLPAVPVLILFAGIGATWSTEKYWKITLNFLLVLSCVYCFLAAGSPAPGKNNRFFASLNSMRCDPNISTSWAIWFNEQFWTTWVNEDPSAIPKKILLVGEAKAFLYDAPVAYHSCFNETPLKEIVAASDPAAEFQRRGIAFVLVDWGEINRFRHSGNYGYTEIVQPELFDKLVADGILERFCPTEELGKTSTVVYRVRTTP